MKHINSKPTVQKYKVCKKEFKSTMELARHIAKEHRQDEEALTNQLQSTSKSDEEGKHTNFALSESMPDGLYRFT